jgi:hypothetical protein
VNAFVSSLQSAYLSGGARLNLFYFAGPNADTEGPVERLGPLAKNHDGDFRVLTAKRLEELIGERIAK